VLPKGRNPTDGPLLTCDRQQSAHRSGVSSGFGLYVAGDDADDLLSV
jgi:hypothetical protein